MEQIIKNLLLSDNDAIKKATTDLTEAYKNPETIPALCELAVSSADPQVRQYSAVLLRKRLGKQRNWNGIPVEQQSLIKHGMLNAMVTEQVKAVRIAIAHLVGVLVKHESERDNLWMGEVLKFIFSRCASVDRVESELGASTFAILSDVAPDQFIPHMEVICEMFTAALMSAEASGDMVNPVIYNILLGMGSLVPFALGNNTAERTYQKSIPIIIKCLEGFAIHDHEKFVKAFDILENIADYTPKLLSANLKPLLDFCLQASNNIQLDNSVRIKTVTYIGWLVRLKKNIIIKAKMIEPIIQVVFNLMATEPEDEDDDEDYFLGDNSSNPMTTATQTMDLLALHVPPEKLIPPLLQLLEPAICGNQPLPKKAAFLCIAVIAEGCSETICSKYLPPLLDIIKGGITDPNPIVRNAAFFALGQFSEHLQPDITKYAPDILPILFDYLQQLSNHLKSGATEPKNIDRMFYALETFCENLEDAIVPHLAVLMEKLFQALDFNNSVRLRELALSAVSAAANAAKSSMLPYFPRLIEGLKTYLVKTDNEDICSLRPQAIDTLASLARTIGKENFLPLASDTMNFALNLLEDADDPDLRRSLFNLISALAEVVNEKMEAVFPKVIDRFFSSVLSTEEVIPEFKEDCPIIPDEINVNDENLDREIDIEHSDDEDDADLIAGYSVENAYLDEKEEAILALKGFAEHTGAAFMPYLNTSYEHIYKMIDHPQEDIRKVSIDALCTFLITLHKQNQTQSVAVPIVILINKLAQIIISDEECTVVMAALEGIADLLKELKSAAIPNQEVIDAIFSSIHDVMLGKIACQFDEVEDEDQEESEYDEAIVERAGNILPLFGEAISPDQFVVFFEKLCPIIIKKIEKSRGKEEQNSQRSFGYGSISECFSPLQHHSGTYFNHLLPVLLAGVQDDFEQVRQNAVFGLGELVLHAKEKSYDSFPKILAALSHAVSTEKHQGTLDNICGAIARLIITNSSLIPLDQVLPVYIQHLPLKEDFDENTSIFKSFKCLCIQGKQEILQYIDQIIMIGLQTVYKKEYKDEEIHEEIVSFLKELRNKFPDKFMNVLNGNPEFAAINF